MAKSTLNEKIVSLSEFNQFPEVGDVRGKALILAR